jgi:hypothetical protein
MLSSTNLSPPNKKPRVEEGNVLYLDEDDCAYIIQQLKKENAQLEQEKAKLEEAKPKLEEKKAKLKEENAKLKEENAKLKEEKAKEKAELERQNKRIKELTDEIEATKKALGLIDDEENDTDDDDDDDDDSVCDGSPWSKKYHLLKAYKQQYGHCNVSQKEDKSLFIWLKDRKADYCQKKGKMSPVQIAKLEKLGVHWGKKYPQPKSWEDWYNDLVTYKTTFGHCNIPTPAKGDITLSTPLARWVTDQRKHGKRLKKQIPSEMTMSMYQRLDELGFVWKTGRKKTTKSNI